MGWGGKFKIKSEKDTVEPGSSSCLILAVGWRWSYFKVGGGVPMGHMWLKQDRIFMGNHPALIRGQSATPEL